MTKRNDGSFRNRHRNVIKFYYAQEIPSIVHEELEEKIREMRNGDVKESKRRLEEWLDDYQGKPYIEPLRYIAYFYLAFETSMRKT